MTHGRCWHKPFSCCSRGNLKAWICLVIFLFVVAHLLVSQLLLDSTSGSRRQLSSSVVIVSSSSSVSQSRSRHEDKHVWRKMGIKHVASTSGSTNDVPLALPLPQPEAERDKHLPNINPRANANDVIASSLRNGPENEQQVARRKGEADERKKNIPPPSSRSMTERSERIKQVCRRRGIVSNPAVFVTYQNTSQPLPNSKKQDPFGSETPNTSHFSMVPSFQTMGCFLNKVASSSLVSAFLLIQGLGPTFTSPHSLIFHLLPRTMEDFKFANSTFFKFMFVRHPMDRMLSCYIDKMVESPHISLPAFRGYVRNKAREVMRNRKQVESHLKTEQNVATRKLQEYIAPADLNKPSHSQQVKYSFLDKNGMPATALSQQVEVAHNNPFKAGDKFEDVQRPLEKTAANAAEAEPSKQIKGKPIPTFEEFLEFVLSTDLQGLGYDAHWVPFHTYCTPCSVPYHFIGKLETAGEDFEFIWKTTGISTKVPIPWVNQKIAPSKSKIAMEKRYYSSLPKELILRFYQRFRLDFEMFDYSINEILMKAGYDPIEEDEF